MTHSSSRFRTLTTTLAVIAVVTLAGSLLDRLLHRDGISHQYLLDLSNLLTGLLAAFIFYHSRREHLQQKRLLQEKLRIVAEMNHHIRNALQVIALCAAKTQDENGIQVIRQAAERIEWSLREILPSYPTAAENQLAGTVRTLE